MGDVEFASFAEHVDNVKAGWISHYCSHHFLGLNCWLFLFGRLFAQVKPDQLVVGTDILI
jgi:hypothetical protein